MSAAFSFAEKRKEGMPMAVFTGNEQKVKSQKERIKEITEELEAGVSAVFESENFQTVLKTFSKFHSYSLNNCLLIAMQAPGSSYLAGYVDWQRKFGRHVRKGEKGIRILAPCKYKVEVEDPAGLNEGDPAGRKTIEKVGFKIAYVWDISQTEGPDLPSLDIHELTGDVRDYRRFYNALVSISPVPISFEDIEGGAKGYYNDAEKKIAIKTGMSEMQTIKTLIHEISHASYHSKEARDKTVPLDRRHMETEAEAIASVVLSAYSMDSSSYSYPYLASYSSGKDVKELKDSLERIRSAADEIITGIDRSLEKQVRREQARASRDEAR